MEACWEVSECVGLLDVVMWNIKPSLWLWWSCHGVFVIRAPLYDRTASPGSVSPSGTVPNTVRVENSPQRCLRCGLCGVGCAVCTSLCGLNLNVPSFCGCYYSF